LARCLVDATADPSSRFNNASLAVLGSDLLASYTSEYIVSSYPRLPLAVVFAAMYAYVGPRSLATITREWGVEYAAAPGGEVDPAYLQFTRVPPQPQEETFKIGPDLIAAKSGLNVGDQGDDPTARVRWGMSQRSVNADVFGGFEDLARPPKGMTDAETMEADTAVTAEKASMNFVRAVMGAIYLHAGRMAAKKFFQDHIRSRQLNMSSLFQFRFPARDLDKLCRREGFQTPVARILAETGRRSRHPVFIVGVFSGNEKLGEGAGASLDEARTRAAVAALKGWYLYSPLEVRVPSEMEDPNARDWEPIMVDFGDTSI
jgi:dsRNA-specific ribonuclease